MSKTLAIIGAGHLGQQIANFAVADNHYSDVVYFDDFSISTEFNGCRVLGKTDDIILSFENGLFDELIIGIGYKHPDVRKKMFEKFSKLVPIGTIVHSSCWVDPTAKIGAGSVLYPSCCIDSNTIIEQNVILNLKVTVSHDSTIGRHSFIAPAAAVAGFVSIGECCFLGINATITDNVVVHSNAVIGAGALVYKNITVAGTYTGNPFRKLR